jgi:hypothetical protein
MHTPGPWRYAAKLSASENHKGYIVRADSGWAVADVWPLDENGKEGGLNSSLIAAAPDLLEAARNAVGAYGPLPGYDHCLRKLLAAIARAEGK